MRESFQKGVYPVMLTPFTEENRIDEDALGKLTEWYIENGAAGLFAVCQSSEMCFLSLKERMRAARYIKKCAGNRVSVIASGHVSESMEEQAEELCCMAETGVDAVILLTNRLAAETESDAVWLENLQILLDRLPKDLPLGFYECPYPYKRLLSPELLRWCADSGRFYFIKDTSCDLDQIRQKLSMIRGSTLQLFNANSSTLLESLEMGSSGFSGVMANFHIDLYAWLCGNYEQEPEKARKLADFLTMASLIERQIYPVNAKYCQKLLGNLDSIFTRVKDADRLGRTERLEVEQLMRLTDLIRKEWILK